MKTSDSRFLAVAAGISFASALLAQAAPTAAKPAIPAVYFAGTRGGACNYELAQKLSEAGLALGTQHHPGLARKPLDWDTVRKYNVLVLAGLGYANADMSLPRHITKTLAVLRRFLDAGGGVLLLPRFGQMAVEKPPEDAFLTPLGLTPLFDEMPVDSEAVTATPWKIPFAWAHGIEKGPFTRGVKGLWYPVPPRRIGAQNHTLPFVAQSNWQVLLRGGLSAATRKGRLQENAPTQPGTYRSSVPVAASREVGRGRFVYFGITYEYITGAHAWTTLEGIVLDQGLHNRKSDGLRFLTQALQWLAAPSLASGDLGGASNDASLLRNPHKTRFIAPFRWLPEPAFPDPGLPAPGVIGARTRYSTGTATPDEWVAAARKAGLAFLVFLEDSRELSPAEFGQLKADCARLSDAEFAAIPGFVIDDEVGNHYFYFGSSFPYPDAKFLTPDSKRFRSRDPELAPKDPYIPGQLSMTTLDYAYSTCGFKLAAGNYLFHHDAAPFSDFFSDWDTFALLTVRNGTVIEDALDDYLEVVDSGQGPVCVALDLMDSPEQLAGSPRRTVLRLAKGTAKAAEIKKYFDTWRLYPDNPLECYVTSGPSIDAWAFAGPRDYEGRNRGDFVWQNWRWRLHGAVSSPVGLTELTVYDGRKLFRRFLPGGAKQFSFDMDLTHDRQHNLVLVATDRNGGRAVSREQWDRNHRAEEFMCSDRNNQLSYGYLTRNDGTGLLLGGNQSLATPFKRIAGGISPPGTFRNDSLLGAPAFDGAAGGEPEVWEHVRPIGVARDIAAHEPTVSHAFRLLHSMDVHIGEGVREHYFTDGIRVANVWHTLWKTAPADAWTVRRQNTFFQVDPDRPIAVFLWHISFQLKRDLPNRGFDIASVAPRECRMWALRGSDGRVLTGRWEDTRRSPGRTLTLPFSQGAYAAFLDGPMGQCAVFPLTDGLQASLRLPGRSSLYLRLPADAAPQHAGETRTIDLLLVGMPRMTRLTQTLPTASNETVERFFREYGLDGGPGAVGVTAKAGTVRGSRYILNIDGAAAHGFSGTLTGRLVSSLPVAVSGLNDRWSALLYDAAMKAARPIGVFAGTAWAVVRLQNKRNLFIGHPVVCDSPDLFVQATQSGAEAWSIEVHNPTDKPIATVLRPNPLFPPFRTLSPETVRLAGGSSVHRTFRTAEK